MINMLDQRVWSLTPHFVSYTVAKAGLWALTQQMALALAPRIRVNAIGPGPALPSPRQSAGAVRAAGRVRSRFGRGTSPEEIGARRAGDPGAAVDDRADDRARRRASICNGVGHAGAAGE